MLKKLYDDEKNRINTLKLEALQSEGLVKTFASAAATEGGAFEKKLRVCDRTVVPKSSRRAAQGRTRRAAREGGSVAFLSKKYVFYNQINFVRSAPLGGTKGTAGFQTNFVCSESEAFQCDCLQRDTKKRVQKIHTGIKNCNSILQFILFYATSNNVNQNRY